MIKYSDFIEIVLGQMPVDTGFMLRNGVEFFDTSYEMVAIYNTNGVPYIVYNEEGTIYTQKNKGFITSKTWGQLMAYANSDVLGLPFDMAENNQKLLANQDKMLVGLGAVQYV